MDSSNIGPFEIERQIGVGGMGMVYSAIYTKNGKRVALKLLAPGLITDPKVLKRFEREMEILKRLDHPNIVKYYGGGTEGDKRYYAMEFIDGGSLQDVLKKRKKLDWKKTIHVGRQISAALEHAHNAGIIHRDLKPANLFLSRKGRLKLGDFGIARDTEATALTAAGKTVGTYAYMAPEQIQVSHPINRRTDLYALGCLLYEVIVGETPFQSDNPMDMLMQHLNDDPYNVSEKVSGCPPQLDQLIERLLAKDPEDRPYDALAVHTELGEIRDAAETDNSEFIEDTVVAGELPPRVGSSKKKKKKAEEVEAAEQPKKKKKKKKKKPTGPFYERTWFLVMCLLVLAGATTWMMLPPGEDWYRDQWLDAMQEGDDSEDREYARRDTLADHIDPYLERFPDGKHVEEATELSDEIHADMLEAQLKNLAKRDTPIDPPFKADCVIAASREDDEGLVYVPTWSPRPSTDLQNDPLPALVRWDRLAKRGRELTRQRSENADDSADLTDKQKSLVTHADEIRQLTRLCQNHHDYFRQKFGTSPLARQFTLDRMQQIEEWADGNATERTDAKAFRKYFIDEFGQIDRLKDFVEFVKERSAGRDAQLPAADDGATTDSDDSNDAGAAADDT